ncbi:hypothetical protein SO694_00018111 [Aureococcus anophagefferens]|uniref:WIBG Mago-binding domain-containing protein n=1 Tax=Aureococcus anophagefferens TaxID=44056 RepID=A0ABR1G0F6_AURAN
MAALEDNMDVDAPTQATPAAHLDATAAAWVPGGTIEEGGSRRPDGSLRKKVRVRQGWAAQREPRRFAPRGSGASGGVRSAAALARGAEAARARAPTRALPPVDRARLLPRAPPPGCAGLAGPAAVHLDVSESAADGASLLVEWFSERPERSRRARVHAGGRARSGTTSTRSSTATTAWPRRPAASARTGPSASSTRRRRGESAEDRAAGEEVDALWRLVLTERDTGGAPEAADLSRGELRELCALAKPPPWLAALREKQLATVAAAATLSAACEAGDAAAVLDVLGTHRSALFADHATPPLHLAVAAGSRARAPLFGRGARRRTCGTARRASRRWSWRGGWGTRTGGGAAAVCSEVPLRDA